MDLLRYTDHRPWPLPPGPWVMAQVWNRLLFAHWPVAPEAIRPLIPAGLALDTWEGAAWISSVPFTISGLRGHWLPPLPGLRAFPELNLRTYVTRDEKPGVFFFSLDAANRAAVRAARLTYHLPYFDAQMGSRAEGDATVYASRRTHRGAPPAEFGAVYRPNGPVFNAAPGSRDHWLAERYCLYAVRGEQLYRAQIHHLPWALQPAEARITLNTLAAAHGIALPDLPPLLQYSQRQPVLIWWPERLSP